MRTRVLAVSLATITVACGSGHDHPTTPIPTGSDTVATIANLTGYIYAVNGIGSQHYQRAWYATDTAVVGDNNGNANPSAYRGVIAFTLPSLPSGATLSAATLAIIPCAIAGNPFHTLGNIVADHLVATTAPDSATYDTTAIATSVATILTDSSLAPDTAALTTSVAADYTAGASTSMYRLRFSTADYDASDSTKSVAFCPPHLIITYVR
jgi:hypothetical protein